MRAFRFVLIVLLAMVFDLTMSPAMGSAEAIDMEKVARRPSIHSSIRTLHEITACKHDRCFSLAGIHLFQPIRKPMRGFVPNLPIRKLPPPVTDNSDSPASPLLRTITAQTT
jgi:hypothetical protein